MPGWKTPATGQITAHEGWLNGRRVDIRSNFEHMRAHLKPEDSILDVGCYGGYLKDYFGWSNYTGIDAFREHVDLARRWHPQGERCFRIGDLFDLEEKMADVVICSRVLIHLPRFDEAVAKLISAA